MQVLDAMVPHDPVHVLRAHTDVMHRTHASHTAHIIYQNGLQATSGFHTPKAVTYHAPTVMWLFMIGHSLGRVKRRFAVGSQHLWVPGVQPKHVRLWFGAGGPTKTRAPVVWCRGPNQTTSRIQYKKKAEPPFLCMIDVYQAVLGASTHGTARKLIADFQGLAKARLADFGGGASSSDAVASKAKADVLRSIESYCKTGRVPQMLTECAIFQAKYFKGELVPVRPLKIAMGPVWPATPVFEGVNTMQHVWTRPILI